LYRPLPHFDRLCIRTAAAAVAYAGPVFLPPTVRSASALVTCICVFTASALVPFICAFFRVAFCVAP
jgi:hypothetical protein